MRPIKMCHGSYARTILSEQEAARLRAQGWVEVKKEKSVTKGAAEQRRFREARKQAGDRELVTWLDKETFNWLAANRNPGESMAGVITRLVKQSRLTE